MEKILIIQTSFIGDVVLATSLLEKLHQYFPDSKIDFLVRKGNHGLFENHPFLNELIVWDKKNKKTTNLLRILKRIRNSRYDSIINVQRFFSTGFLTAFSKAKHTIGFDKNPLSFLFSKKVPHWFGVSGKEMLEVERNQLLIESITDSKFVKPKLYPTEEDFSAVATDKAYVCMAPNSVWFTKVLPKEKWAELTNRLKSVELIYLIGGPADKEVCEYIKSNSEHTGIKIVAGKLSFLQSCALIKNAKMNYVNDSAPLHFASAMNAPVTSFFCSTVPAFGFTPLSDDTTIMEVKEKLECRPCGMHGKKACPKGHFDCAKIDISQIKMKDYLT